MMLVLVRADGHIAHCPQKVSSRPCPFTRFATSTRHRLCAVVCRGVPWALAAQVKLFLDVIQQSPGITNVCEIGFNAGHSALTFLSMTNNTQVVSFDLGTHPYFKPSIETISAMYARAPPVSRLLCYTPVACCPLVHEGVCVFHRGNWQVPRPPARVRWRLGRHRPAVHGLEP